MKGGRGEKKGKERKGKEKKTGPSAAACISLPSPSLLSSSSDKGQGREEGCRRKLVTSQLQHSLASALGIVHERERPGGGWVLGGWRERESERERVVTYDPGGRSYRVEESSSSLPSCTGMWRWCSICCMVSRTCCFTSLNVFWPNSSNSFVFICAATAESRIRRGS